MDLTSETQKIARDGNNLHGIMRDATISAAIVCAITLPICAAVGSVQGGAMWLLLPFVYILPFLMFGAPFAVAFYGFAMLRTGFVLGPLLLVGLVGTAGMLYMRIGDSRVRAFATQSVAPASRPHGVLMMDGNINCETAECERILGTTSYAIAFKAVVGSKGWQLLWRGEGDACLADGQRQSASMFAAAGFGGMCAIQSNVPDIADGLMLRVRHLGRDRSEATGVPAAFAGSVYEIIERMDGRDRVLGRRLDGFVGLPIPQAVALFISFSLGLTAEYHIVSGPRIEPAEFLAAASRTPSDKPFGG
jgi:hypothetical protein